MTPDPKAARPERDLLKPLLGAGTCFLLFMVAMSVLVPLLRFVGGELIALTVSTLISAVVSNALAMAIFESRSWMDLGLGWRVGIGRNLAMGAGLGCAAALLSVLPDVAAGVAQFRAAPGIEFSWRAAMFLPVLLFCGALGEELAFRGFVLQYVVSGYGKWVALAGSGILFGILHKDNPGATWLSVVNTALFGILFGYALVRSHDLWLPIGLHFGWNATLPFLGVELSGLTIKIAGYTLVWNTGDMWSGGKYGPEAGLTATAVLTLLFVAVWRIPVTRNFAALLEPESAPSV